jgi:hypothetical protein
MYKKKSFADQFNRKKTQQNELKHLQNIHKKINYHLPIATYQYTPLIKFETPNNTIYNFNQIISTNVNFHTQRENNDIDKIPKIILKELPIPSYSETDKFDLNFSVPITIPMDIFICDIIHEDDVNRIKKKNIHKIIHVYQEKYAFNSYPTGFGDFIRSCFFIIQFCTKYGFQYEFIINHPISQFLKNFSMPNPIFSFTLNNNVQIFSETNWAESVFDNQNYIENFLLIKQKFNRFIDYLCSLHVINGSVFSYNIFFPYNEISLEECNKIRSLFEPSREISDKIDLTLYELQLFKNQFITLHIRSGDSYLINENKVFDSIYFEIIKNEIIEIIFKNKDVDILLIADNNEIKLLLSDFFPNIKYFINNITHIGEGVELETEKVKNTMLDFYLFSHASQIMAFSVYEHGSGFSQWCATTYDIPYVCRFI